MPNSKKPHETPTKRKRGEDPTALAPGDLEQAAGQLAGKAEALIVESEAMLQGVPAGGIRARALQGIGYALCSIACNLDRVADAGEMLAEGAGFAWTPKGPFGTGGKSTTPEAVVCVDCQAAHDHGPGRCMDVTGCAVCVGPDPHKCACCDGELVLARSGPESDSVEARIDRWRNQEGGKEDEAFVELLCDAQLALAAYREKLANYCDDASCAKCRAGEPCRSISPEEVAAIDQLTPPGVQSDWLRCGCAVGHHEDRYVAPNEVEGHNRCSLGWPRAAHPNKVGVTCGEDSSHWCSHHCPRERDAVLLSGHCAGGKALCSEHCP